MKPVHSFRTYLAFGSLAATGYLIIMAFFLQQHNFQALWMLPMGNVLYLFSVAGITYYFYQRNHFRDSSVSNALGGHFVSFTGAALSVLVTFAMYYLFQTYVWKGGSSAPLPNAPGSMPASDKGGILPYILIDAGFGNTVCGFFAAILISFSAKRNQRSEVKG